MRTAITRAVRGALRLDIARERRTLAQRWSPLDTELALRRLLTHATHTVPYYADCTQSTKGAADLAQIPRLSREQVRTRGTPLLSTDAIHRRSFANSSGGSTGQPVTVRQDPEFVSWNAVAEDYFYCNLIRIPDYRTTPKLIIWGSERDLRLHKTLRQGAADYLSGRVILNAFRLDASALQTCVAAISKHHPTFVKGYAGALFEVSRYILDQAIHIPQVRRVYSSAECLLPEMREVIEAAFGGHVYDFYGSRETGPLAGQCSKGLLHTFPFHNVVEVVDPDGREVSEGQEGDVLVTTLRNYSMPLIRYELGDRAIRGPACDCGCPFPTIQTILGRRTDCLIAHDGTRIHGEYFTHLFYFKPWLSAFQVVQTESDAIDIKYVPCGAVAEQERKNIEDLIRVAMRGICRVTWREVNDIAKTAQGKRCFTICQLTHKDAI